MLCTTTVDPEPSRSAAPPSPTRTSSTPASSTTQTHSTSLADVSYPERVGHGRIGVGEGCERLGPAGPQHGGEAGLDDAAGHRTALGAEPDEPHPRVGGHNTEPVEHGSGLVGHRRGEHADQEVEQLAHVQGQGQQLLAGVTGSFPAGTPARTASTP